MLEKFDILLQCFEIEALASSETASVPKSKTSVVSSVFVFCCIVKTISPLI